MIYRITLVALGVLFLWLTVKVDLLIFAGILLAISLHRTAAITTRLTRLPHSLALGVVIVLVIGAVAAAGWLFATTLAQQFTELSSRLSSALATMTASAHQLPMGKALLRQLRPSVLFGPNGVFGSFFGFASNLIDLVGGLFFIVFIGFYGAVEPDVYIRGALRLVPPQRRPRVAELLAESGSALWYWLLGRLLSMTILGCLSAVGLWALGVPMPLALGLFAGLLAFVPYIGAFVSAVPAVLLGAALSFRLALYVVALYGVVHFVEAYILVPLVQRRAAHLPPALSLASQVILGTLVGLVGFLLATPLLAAVLILVRGSYVEDVLDDHRTPPDGSSSGVSQSRPRPGGNGDAAGSGSFQSSVATVCSRASLAVGSGHRRVTPYPRRQASPPPRDEA